MGIEVTTNTIKKTGLRTARGDDCELFFGNLSQVINASRMETFQHAERSIGEIAEDIYHHEVRARGIINENPSKEKSIKSHRIMIWLTMVGWFVLLAIFSLAFGGTIIKSILSTTSSTPVSYWEGTGYMFIWLSWVPVLIGLWRGYIDLYIKAWFRWWWTLKDQPRGAIETGELIDYLADHLEEEDFSVFAIVDPEKFGKRFQALQDRLSSLNKALEEADKLKNIETIYSDIHAQLRGRIELLKEQADAVDKKRQEAKKIAAELIDGRLEQYRELSTQIDSLLNRLEAKESGKTTSIMHAVRDKRKGSAQKLAEDIKKIPMLLEEAYNLADKALVQDDKYDSEDMSHTFPHLDKKDQHVERSGTKEEDLI